MVYSVVSTTLMSSNIIAYMLLSGNFLCISISGKLKGPPFDYQNFPALDIVTALLSFACSSYINRAANKYYSSASHYEQKIKQPSFKLNFEWSQ